MDQVKQKNSSLLFRVIIVLIVLIISFMSVLLGFPLAKLLGVSPSELQGAGFDPNFKTLTIVVAFAAFQFLLIFIVVRYIHKKSISSLGFNKPIIRPLLIGTAFGILMQISEYFILYLFGNKVKLINTYPYDVEIWILIGYGLLNIVFLLTLNSLKEEIVFRAYPLTQFEDYPHLVIPLLVIVSLIFAAVHHILLPFALDDFVSRFTIALLLSFVFYRWKSIWLIAGIHNGLNLLEYLIGGNYKMGGLFKFSLENSPSLQQSIITDIIMAFAMISLFQIIWIRENKIKKFYLGITHGKH